MKLTIDTEEKTINIEAEEINLSEIQSAGELFDRTKLEGYRMIIKGTLSVDTEFIGSAWSPSFAVEFEN